MKKIQRVLMLVLVGFVGLISVSGKELMAQSVNWPCNPPSVLTSGFNGGYLGNTTLFSHITYTQSDNIATITILPALIGVGFTTGNITIPANAKEVTASLYAPFVGPPVGTIKVCTGHNYGQGPELRVRAVIGSVQVVPDITANCAGINAQCFQRYRPDPVLRRGR